MIKLTRLNDSVLIVNCELIETIEETPDTVIRLINGNKIIVQESAEDIISSVVEYKRKLLKNPIINSELS